LLQESNLRSLKKAADAFDAALLVRRLEQPNVGLSALPKVRLVFALASLSN
jgi:hypothetical protein